MSRDAKEILERREQLIRKNNDGQSLKVKSGVLAGPQEGSGNGLQKGHLPLMCLSMLPPTE